MNNKQFKIQFSSILVKSLNSNLDLDYKIKLFLSLFHIASGKVFGFGNNGDGQLGLGNSNSQNVVSPALVQLPTIGSEVKMMSAGNDHSMLLTGMFLCTIYFDCFLQLIFSKKNIVIFLNAIFKFFFEMRCWLFRVNYVFPPISVNYIIAQFPSQFGNTQLNGLGTHN